MVGRMKQWGALEIGLVMLSVVACSDDDVSGGGDNAMDGGVAHDGGGTGEGSMAEEPREDADAPLPDEYMDSGAGKTDGATNEPEPDTEEEPPDAGMEPEPEPSNHPPEAADLAVEAVEDTPLELTLSGTDEDGDSLTFVITSPPQNGELSQSGEVVTYTPSADYSGEDAFEYTVDDGTDASESYTVSIDVLPVNDAPVAVDDSYSLEQGGVLSGADLLANDSDVDGDSLNVTIVQEPDLGTLTLDMTGGFSYEHGGGGQATDSFSYEICDPSGECDLATVVLTIEHVNQAPVAVGDSFDVDLGATTSVEAPGVLANDADPEGSELQATLVEGPTSGTLTLAEDGSFSYTPDPSGNTVDGFRYEACDEGGACARTDVVLNVVDRAQFPTMVADQFTVAEGGSLMSAPASLLDNDTDPTGSVLNVATTPSAAPSHGMVTLSADGTFVYQHDGSETRSDSFSYEACNRFDNCASGFVTITVTPVNDAPTAVNDTYALVEGELLEAQISVLNNDLDAEAGALTAQVLTGPSSGTLSLETDGRFSYQHDGGTSQQDSFTYEACDADGACGPATVTLNIQPRNEPPEARDDHFSVQVGVIFRNAVSVLNNDVDPDGDDLAVNATLITEPSYGNAAIDAGGFFSYIRSAAGTTTDSFTYEVCDPSGRCAQATAYLAVTVSNAPPAAAADAYTLDEGALFSSGAASLLDNDTDSDAGDVLVVNISPVTDPTNGVLVLAGDGTFSYQHDGSETTSDSFTYEVCDSANECDTAEVTLTINPQNDPPVAVDDTLSVNEGASGDVNLLANDSDVDVGDSFSNVTVITPPTRGSVTALNTTTGLLTYQHDGSETTSDSLVYRVQDSGGLTTTATLTITITPVDDPASAVNDTYSNVTGNTVLTAGAPGLLANDSDPDGPSLAVCPQTNAASAQGGLVTVNANGSFSYLPPVGLRSATDSFTYRVASPDCSTGPTATVNLTIGAAAAWYVDANSTQPGDGRSDFGGASYGYQTLAGLSAATLQSGDVVVVYRNNADPTPAGSALDAAVSLPDGVALVGDGVALPNSAAFPAADYPNLNLPHVSIQANVDGPPRITNSTGVAISLEGNNALVGLEIVAPGTSGVADSDGEFDDVLIDTVTVSAAGSSSPGDAVDLSNTVVGGSVIVRNSSFSSADGAAFSVVNAGSVSVDDDEASDVDRDMTLDAIGGPAFSVIGAGTSLDVVLSELNSTGSSGSGVVISGATGSFSVSGTTTVTSSTSAGLLVQDAGATATSASLVFNGLVTVNNAATAGGGLSLSGYLSTLAFAAVDIDASSGAGIAHSGTSSGILLFTTTVDVNTTTGHGLSFSGSSGAGITFDGNLTSITTSGTAFQTSMSGTVATNGAVSLSSSSGTGLSVSGTHLVMDATETNSLTASTGVGINVSSSSGCQVDFDTVTVTNPSGAGVSLTSNAGSSFALSGLTIATLSGAGLYANGGGTVSVTGATNTVNTTGATAVELTNTTIGASGVTLLSVSASDSTEGLHLEGTGSTGAFQITGTGTTAQSGGIMNTLTGNGVVLSAVENVTLKNLEIGTPVAATADKSTSVTVAGDGIDMTSATDVTLEGLDIGSTGVHGIDGTGVVNLTVRNTDITNSGDGDGESGVSFEEVGQNNLSGTVLFDTVVIAGSTEHNVSIQNSSGTLNATFTGCVFRRTFDSGSLGFGQHGMLLRSESTATMTVLVDDGTFLEHEADGLDAVAEDTSTMNLTVQDSYFEGILQSAAPLNYSDNAILIGTYNSATLRFSVNGNDIQDHPASAITVSSNDTSTLNGTVSNNTVGTDGVSDSGSESGYGIDVFLDDDSTSALSISGNTLHGHEGYGIQVLTQTLHSGNITVENNTISTPDNNGPLPFSWECIYLRTAGTSSACFDVSGNAAEIGATDFGITGASIYASANSVSAFNLYQGSSGSSVPVTVLADNNPASFSHDASGPITVVTSACTLPGVTPTPP
jgi:VCBS repeat-containing protein